ncbi:MAG TPA: hypothetical protein VG298_06705 [Acidimicrobiales bacterium]|nr:hypothetical protein [Acidimicrobiales bacterium]
MLGLGLFALFAAGLGYLVGNEVQGNTQFDQAHRSLGLAQGSLHAVRADLGTLRRNLGALNGEIGQTAPALGRDTAQLQSDQAALARSQANFARQGSAIIDLQACLGGVEQALNALSVGDQRSAVDALNAAATSCQSAVATNG